MVLCYLLGYPVGHSMSAHMQNAAFKELGLDLRYELLSTKPEELEEAIEGVIRGRGVRGANVTIPHKVSVLRFLDEVDEESSLIGAVNTIVNDDGWLKGYNTDAYGALRSLEDAYGRLNGSRVVIIGTGGAARAIGFKLSTTVGSLTIASRTREKAQELSSSIKSSEISIASVTATDMRGIADAVSKADILINATPVGMAPDVDETPVDGGLLRSGLTVFDAVYNPPRTRFLREAEASGANVISGIKMLVYQGAASFELWTGHDAPVRLMESMVRKRLKEERP